MSRIDVPTLTCDRCSVITQDTREMVEYQTVIHYHMSGRRAWDLCPDCWREFQKFMGESE